MAVDTIVDVLKCKRDVIDFREELLLHLRQYRSIRSVEKIQQDIAPEFPQYQETIQDCCKQRIKEINNAYS